MNGIEVIRNALHTSAQVLEPLLDDVAEHPLATPTSDGGNHPLWTVGHLAYGESSILSMITGDENPLAQWKELFDGGTTPLSDDAIYPSYADVRTAYRDIRQRTLAFLDTLTDAALDTECADCPEELKPLFGTYGKCLTAAALHAMHHRGQVADVRRSLHRQPLFA